MRACFYLRTHQSPAEMIRVVLRRRRGGGGDSDRGEEDELLQHPEYSSNEGESGE